MLGRHFRAPDAQARQRGSVAFSPSLPLAGARAEAAVEQIGMGTRGLQVLVAHHDGSRRLPHPVQHRRSWRYETAGATLVVGDELLCSGTHAAGMLWHFAPECQVTCTERVITAERDGVRVSWSLRGPGGHPRSRPGPGGGAGGPVRLGVERFRPQGSGDDRGFRGACPRRYPLSVAAADPGAQSTEVRRRAPTSRHRKRREQRLIGRQKLRLLIFHASRLSTRSRPNCPIRSRRSGSSSSATILSAKSMASFGLRRARPRPPRSGLRRDRTARWACRAPCTP